MAPQPDTIPTELTSFVGRRQEITAVRGLLSTARLVTLTGIGGIGKTRLALRVAVDARRAFADGVCVVELASLKDPAVLPHYVIDALDIREQSARDPGAVVCDHLRERRMLVVLDNCEHVVGAAAELAEQVLRAAPGVRILATSTQPLRVSGEHLYTVPPLAAPDPGDRIDPGTATRYPSVSLFAARSVAVVPDFELTADNEAAVVRLCHRLEGIPLAIELAAVRLRVLSIDGLVSRLDDRFQLLRDGPRDLPERHRTLQAVIDWSHDLCTPQEQALWARAAVFSGGFTVAALESVCADETLPIGVVLETAAGLLDKSIFIREEQGSHVRFHMLETLRAYGQAKLTASGQDGAVRRRHRDWCVALIDAASNEWVGPRQLAWATILQVERPNLRRALESCLEEPGEARVALHLAAIPWFWLAIGHLAEGRHWLERALALDDAPSRERSWALSTVAYVAVSQGDATNVPSWLDEAEELALELGDPAAQAYATHVRGVSSVVDDDLDLAISQFKSALDRYAANEVPAQYADLLLMELASVQVMCGQIDPAEDTFDELFRRCDAAGDSWHRSYALWGRGLIHLIREEPARAEAELCDSISIKRRLNDTLGLALALDVLAWTSAAAGDARRAATLFGGTSRAWQAIGSSLVRARLLIQRREHYERIARRVLGDSEFDDAFKRGTALTMDEILALALREATVVVPVPPSATPMLTRREREVADLLAGGMSNKEIAAELVISVRTAESHVEHILTKLGFTARTQIASWVTQQRST